MFHDSQRDCHCHSLSIISHLEEWGEWTKRNLDHKLNCTMWGRVCLVVAGCVTAFAVARRIMKREKPRGRSWCSNEEKALQELRFDGRRQDVPTSHILVSGSDVASHRGYRSARVPPLKLSSLTILLPTCNSQRKFPRILAFSVQPGGTKVSL